MEQRDIYLIFSNLLQINFKEEIDIDKEDN